MTHKITATNLFRIAFTFLILLVPIVLYADCSLSIDDPTQGFEGGSGANIITFTVTKTGNSACGTIFSTSDQTATGGGQCSAGNVDYASLINGGLNFSATETSKTIVITTCGDGIDEPDETFVINLFSPTGGATYAKNQGRGTLVDDDPQPSLQISNASVTEGSSGQANLSMNVTLSNPSAFTVTVDFATAANTATAGVNCGVNVDFLSRSGTLTFNPLTTNPQTVSVPICADTAIESNETLRVNLTNAAHASIQVAQATGTITNDDSQPNISINDVTKTEGNTGESNANFNVSTSAAGTNQITVNYNTSPIAPTVEGTCGSGAADYEDSSGTLNFAAGSTAAQIITVHVCGDTTVEANDLFRVNLPTATNANISDNQGQGTITNDDLPTISFTVLQVAEGTGSQLTSDKISFNITLSAANPNGATVSCVAAETTVPKSPAVKAATGGPTCLGGVDFITGRAQTVTFGPTETVKACFVQICRDSTTEPDEGFVVNLSNPQGAKFSDTITGTTAQGGILIKNDD